MASQEVESQLKFTNNVHHATSNTVNIFSQMASSSLMPAPTMTAMGAPTQPLTNSNMTSTAASTASYVHHNENNHGAPVAIIDELKNEIKQVRTENMAKDGEVKILREKLKKLEQDSQRMRTERADLIKKLQTQKEEEKKGLQKQIEFKELENQFKNQEIFDLTMKCKQLESSSKKSNVASSSSSSVSNQAAATPQHNLMLDEINPGLNSNSIKKIKTPSTPTMAPPSMSSHLNNQMNKSTTPQSNHATANNNQQVIGSKGVPTKRMICQTSITSLNGASDTENENPTHDPKR